MSKTDKPKADPKRPDVLHDPRTGVPADGSIPMPHPTMPGAPADDDKREEKDG